MKNYSKIVSGTMTWGDWGKNLNVKEMTKLIENCFEIGVNCFDHENKCDGLFIAGGENNSKLQTKQNSLRVFG